MNSGTNPKISFHDAHQLAAAIDRRMAQLDVDGVRGMAVFNQMGPFLPDLHRIYCSTSDQQLLALCDEFAGFRQFAEISEDAFEAERAKPSRPYDGTPELPEKLKRALDVLLADAASMETDYHGVAHSANRAERRKAMADLKPLYQQWCKAREWFLREAQQAAPSAAVETLKTGLEDIARRIEAIQKRSS
jgi:hypothetical protein